MNSIGIQHKRGKVQIAHQILCICEHSHTLKNKFTAGEYNFLQCSFCGSLYRIPAYFEESTYPDEYYGESETEKFWLSPIISLLEYERTSRAKFLINNANKNSSVIDIGCGNGKLLEKISSLGKNIELSGIELDSKAAKRASKIENVKIYNSAFQETELKTNKFDIICMIHSFEHIPEPENIIKKLKNISSTESILYIAIPNISSFQFIIFGKHWLHLDPEWHLHFIKPATLIQKMDKAGFKLIKQKHFHPVQNIPGFIMSTMNLFTKKRDVLFNMLKSKSSLKKPLNLIIFFLLMLFAIILSPIAIVEEILATLFRKGATIDLIFKKLKD